MKTLTFFLSFFFLGSFFAMTCAADGTVLEYGIDVSIRERSYRLEVRDYNDGFKTVAVWGACDDMNALRADLEALTIVDAGTAIDCFDTQLHARGSGVSRAGSPARIRGAHPDADGEPEPDKL